MKMHALLVAALVALMGGCDRGSADEQREAPPALAAPSHGADVAGAPHQGAPGQQRAGMPENHPATTLAGQVAETMDAGRYTYIRLETGRGSVWAAAPQMDVSVGDRVEIGQFSVMQGFRSPTLDRTFDEILFANRAAVVSGDEAGRSPTSDSIAGRPHGHPPVGPGGMPSPHGSPAQHAEGPAPSSQASAH